MKDKLRAIERKIEILKVLTVKKQSTRRELAEAFNVSVDTIARDITDIVSLLPFTQREVIKAGYTYCLSTGVIETI